MTHQQLIIEKLERLENNARRLLEDTAALKEELSGGSDSSISKPVLSMHQREQLIKNRMKTALKQNT